MPLMDYSKKYDYSSSDDDEPRHNMQPNPYPNSMPGMTPQEQIEAADAAAAAQHEAMARSVIVPPPVLVLGAGVNGLTSALMLALDGFEPHIVAEELFEETVSVGAGAIWEYPPFKVLPEELSCRLALASRVYLDALAATQHTGVRQLRTAYAWRDPPADTAAPDLARVEQVRDFTPEVLPAYADEVKGGHWHRAPVLYMRRYLQWLQNMCAELGVYIHPGRKLQSRADVVATARSIGLPCDDPPRKGTGEASARELLVVNCLGLGSARVFGDTTMFPVKGQLAFVKAPHVLDVLDDTDSPHGLTYLCPQADGIVALAGLADVGNDDPEPSDEVHLCILLCTSPAPPPHLPRTSLTPPLHLPCTSSISPAPPLHLPCTSSISPDLPCTSSISPAPPLHLLYLPCTSPDLLRCTRPFSPSAAPASPACGTRPWWAGGRGSGPAERRASESSSSSRRRVRRDHAEIRPRSGRDHAEITPRSGRDQPR